LDHVKDQSAAWEKEYQGKGAVWGGAVHHLPVLPPGSRVLELGCGNGKTLSAMLQRGWDVTAIDFSVRAVLMSRKDSGMPGNGDVCVADARNLPFARDRFDAVVAVHLFSHLDNQDRARAAAEAVRVVKPEGILYFSGFSAEDFRAAKGSIVEEGTVMRGSGICTHYFCEPEIRDLFRTLTLQAITTRRWSMRVSGQDLPRAEIQATFVK
jgi:MPBQ/MSBQ methyltransferase